MATSDSAYADVLDLVRRWAVAEQGNDARALDDLLAPDFVGVGRSASCSAASSGSSASSAAAQRPLRGEDPQVHDHGSAAVVIGVEVQKTTFQGGRNDGRFRLTAVAVRPADRWLLGAVHVGPLQAPPAPPTPPRPPGA